MVFKFALVLPGIDGDRRWQIGITSAALFLVYPFHSESIQWLSGRLSSMAALFAVMALYVTYAERRSWSFALAQLLFLMGLLSYESIFLFPLIVFLFSYTRSRLIREGLSDSLPFLITLVLYLVVRVWLSSFISGSEYGTQMFSGQWYIMYPMRLLKVIGRSLLPPMQNSLLLSMLLLLLVISIATAAWYTRRSWKNKNQVLFFLFLAFLVALILPAAFSVSTRTSEGDRLLYFPSIFLCLLIGFAINTSRQRIVLTLLLIFSMIQLFSDQRHWDKADVAAKETLRLLQQNNVDSLAIVNLPDEVDGAFAFRNGLGKAIIVHHLQGAPVQVVSKLKVFGSINAEVLKFITMKDSIVLPPFSVMIKAKTGSYQIVSSEMKLALNLSPNLNVWFWNTRMYQKIGRP